MKDRTGWTLLALLLCAVAAGLYLWQRAGNQAPPPAPAVAPQPLPPPGAKAAPQILFPVPPAADSPSLPSLELSDSLMRSLLDSLFGRKNFEEFFSPRDIVRRIVATVDSLPREKVAQRLLPLRPPAGPLLVTGGEEDRFIGAGNAARYLPYVALAESVDTGKLVSAYVRCYPLFQQAYQELGYPAGYFNDRLVEVIDHLLVAPDADGPVQLVRRKVLYEFADPDLEARSAGQKIMLRIGPANAARVKAKLHEIRRELTRQPPNG
jgi:hypothetical protein